MMSFDKIKNKECLCAFLESAKDIKGMLNSFITSAITILQTAKAALLLVPLSLEDELRRVKYEAALAVIEAGVSVIEVPFGIVTGYMKPWADCPPVANVAKTVKNVQKYVMSNVDDLRYEIQQYIEALKDEHLKIAQLDRWITTLQDLQEALDTCGE